MSFAKTQPVISPGIDAAEACVFRWPSRGSKKLMAESKLAWLWLWRRAGSRPNAVTLHVSEIGEAQGAQDAMRSGRRLLETLIDAGLIDAVARERGRWTVDVRDPAEALDALRRIDPDPQGELFEEPANNKPALEVASTLVGILTLPLNSEEEVNIPTSVDATSNAGLLDPAHVHTVDSLARLWILSSQVRINGRKRDQLRDIKPQVQGTLDAGIPMAELAAAMRDRENKFEWYNIFATRLLERGAGRRAKLTKPMAEVMRERFHAEGSHR